MAKYVAQKFVAPSPEAEVIGSTMLFYLHNLHSEEIAPLLAKHSLSSFDPGRWYPMQRTLDIQRDIYESNENVSERLVAVGIEYVQNLPLPPEVKSVIGALHMFTQAPKSLQRNIPDDFGTTVQVISEKHARVFHNTPYADDALYGTLWGLVNRVKPKNDMFTVRIINNPDPENHPGTCFDIKWGATWAEVE
jgi:hypothetical protein